MSDESEDACRSSLPARELCIHYKTEDNFYNPSGHMVVNGSREFGLRANMLASHMVAAALN